MADIIGRLLGNEPRPYVVGDDLLGDAAREIQQLRAANVRLQEALVDDPKDQSAKIERLEARLARAKEIMAEAALCMSCDYRGDIEDFLAGSD